MNTKNKAPDVLAKNRKALHEYAIHEQIEAGLNLEGWEVKAIRNGRATLAGAYLTVRSGELFLVGAHITPLETMRAWDGSAACNPVRDRKLLVKRRELDRLVGQVERAGFTLVPLDLHMSASRIKLQAALAKGKKLHDKRDAERNRDWAREQARLVRDGAAA